MHHYCVTTAHRRLAIVVSCIITVSLLHIGDLQTKKTKTVGFIFSVPQWNWIIYAYRTKEIGRPFFMLTKCWVPSCEYPGPDRPFLMLMLIKSHRKCQMQVLDTSKCLINIFQGVYVQQEDINIISSMPSHQRWHTCFSKCNKEDYLSISRMQIVFHMQCPPKCLLSGAPLAAWVHTDVLHLLQE